VLTGDAKTADAGKKVDKRERRRWLLSEGWLNLGERAGTSLSPASVTNSPLKSLGWWVL
jgi:hypothetical protein